eukprot:COSAG03_NODE_215_length_10494_cov_13.007504_11_plen_62_part_00
MAREHRFFALGAYDPGSPESGFPVTACCLLPEPYAMSAECSLTSSTLCRSFTEDIQVTKSQ